MVVIQNYGEYNKKNLKFIGKGIHGKVYKINEDKCIKIFKKNSYCKKELSTLQMSQNNKHFPKIFQWGENYIVREYIDGIELDKYLKNNPLTLELSEKLIELYEALEAVGFKRLDIVLFHIFINKDGNLRLIDTARVMKEKTTYPKLLMDGLKKLGYKIEFINHVKILRSELYERWITERK